MPSASGPWEADGGLRPCGREVPCRAGPSGGGCCSSAVQPHRGRGRGGACAQKGSLEEAAAGACAPSPRRPGRRGARAPTRARTLARSLAPSLAPAGGFSACAPARSHSGACARGLGPTRVAGFPRLRVPAAPSRLQANPSLPFPHGMGPALLGVARPGPGSRSVSRCQPLPGSRRLALSLSQWRRRLR